jgi:prepilin-type N-terminal cleavage/methylation domain-containing protein
MKKAFTLLETLITLVIIGILAVVLTESYLTISKIAFKIEQEKNLTEEALMLTQIFQSITEEATIDYERYNGSLASTSGFTDILYLTGGQRTGTEIYSVPKGEGCLPLEGEFQPKEDGTYDNPSDTMFENSGCQLILQQNGIETPLLATNKLIPSQVKFKIIPFDSETTYFGDANDGEILINAIAKPGVRMFIHLYSPFYQPIGFNNIDQPLQLFFNLNAVLPSIF